MTTFKQAMVIAKRLGLKRGKGTYNGKPFWHRPGDSRIITIHRIFELAE